MKLSALFRHQPAAPAAKPKPAPAARPLRAVDAFEAPRPSPIALTAPPPRAEAAAPAAAAAAVTSAVQSPYFLGRIHRDGKAMVGPGGDAFTWRGVSEFLLPRYLNDRSRSPQENEAIVAGRLDERAAQGYSVVRVFGTLSWAGSEVKPFDDWEAYKANTETLFQLAKDRGLYVEFTAFTDADQTVPPERRGEYVDWVAQVTKKYDNTFVELCNESFKNGLSEQQLYDLGRRFKQTAPDVMLAGSSPTGDGIDGSAGDGAQFGRPPFDYVTLHSERADGDDGFRWVRHMREGESVSAATGRPVVQDEPIGSNGQSVPGRRDSNPQHFVDGALVAAVTGQGFTFHTERAVTADPNAQVAEPGADLTHLSDLIPSDPRGTHFVNGHWPDSPFDVGNQFDTNVLRVFTKMKDDRSGFWTYPVDVKNDLTMTLKAATHLTVVDVATGERVVDRDFASGEVLRLKQGSDVVIYGGAAAVPELKAPARPPAVPGAPDPVLGSADPVPGGQQPAKRWPAPRYQAGAASAVVERLYRAVLGRQVDPAGMAAYAPMVASGNLDGVVSCLVASKEFAERRTSLSVGELATALYRGILERDPDPSGLAGTEQLLRAGQLADRAASMVLSEEYRQRN